MIDMDDLNKRCAIVLGGKEGMSARYIDMSHLRDLHDFMALYMPVFGAGEFRISEMHFHDSYDWLWILIRESEKRGHRWTIAHDCIVVEDENGDVLYESNHFEDALPSTRQIAQAALEVLEANNE